MGSEERKLSRSDGFRKDWVPSLNTRPVNRELEARDDKGGSGGTAAETASYDLAGSPLHLPLANSSQATGPGSVETKRWTDRGGTA